MGLGSWALTTSKMSCTYDKEVWFFGEDSRDISLMLYLFLTVHGHCLLPYRGVHEIKRMYLASRTHGLFIT
jgi:hypothetical protein